MEVGNSFQIGAFLYACGLGFWIGLYYELFRTVRLLFVPSVRACFVQDVLFCLSASVMTFFGFLAIADGNMYPYLFVGEAMGFMSFYHTIGRVLHVVLAACVRWCMAVFTVVGGAISKTFARLCGPFVRLCVRLLRKTQKNVKKFQLFSKKT